MISFTRTNKDPDFFKQELNFMIKTAEVSCLIRPEDQFQSMEIGPVISMVFEEVILQSLLAPLKKLIQEENNFDKKINGIATSCFLRFFILATNCPHKDQVINRLRSELRDMTGLKDTEPLENILSLHRPKVLVIISSVIFFKENFLQVPAGWKVFFEICYMLIQIHEFRMDKDAYPEEDLTTQTQNLVELLTSNLPREELESCFSLHRLLSRPAELSQLVEVYLNLSVQELCRSDKPGLSLLRRASQLVAQSGNKLASDSHAAFRALAKFVDDSVDRWPMDLRDQVLRLILDMAVVFLVVGLAQQAYENARLSNKIIFDFFTGFNKKMKSIDLAETLQDELLMISKTHGNKEIGDGWGFLLESCSDIILWSTKKERKNIRARVIQVDQF
jgi:hypothetical protein